MNELEKNNTTLPSVMCDINREDVMRFCKEYEWKKMIEHAMSMLARVDDGIVLFNNRDYLITSAKITSSIMEYGDSPST